MSEIPKVVFNDAKPNVNFGQIRDVYVAELGNPLTAMTKSHLESRINNAGDNADDLRALTVIGSKEAPESSEINLSHDRTYRTPKMHTISARIDETNEQNYLFMQRLHERGINRLLMWFADDKFFFGGLQGVEVSVDINHVIPESNEEVQYFEMTLKWKGNFPERNLNPLKVDSIYTDTIAPTAEVSPADGATGIAVTTTITVEFSEPVQHVGGLALTNENADQAITLEDSAPSEVAVDYYVMPNKKQVNIVPQSDLSAAETYEVTIENLEDEAGNALATVTSTFTTA